MSWSRLPKGARGPAVVLVVGLMAFQMYGMNRRASAGGWISQGRVKLHRAPSIALDAIRSIEMLFEMPKGTPSEDFQSWWGYTWGDMDFDGFGATRVVLDRSEPPFILVRYRKATGELGNVLLNETKERDTRALYATLQDAWKHPRSLRESPPRRALPRREGAAEAPGEDDPSSPEE